MDSIARPRLRRTVVTRRNSFITSDCSNSCHKSRGRRNTTVLPPSRTRRVYLRLALGYPFRCLRYIVAVDMISNRGTIPIDERAYSHDCLRRVTHGERLILRNAYFLDAVTVCTHTTQTENTSESGQRAARAIDGAVVVVDGGTNVVPTHHLRPPCRGGSPPIRYQGGTVRSRSEVTAGA